MLLISFERSIVSAMPLHQRFFLFNNRFAKRNDFLVQLCFLIMLVRFVCQLSVSITGTVVSLPTAAMPKEEDKQPPCRKRKSKRRKDAAVDYSIEQKEQLEHIRPVALELGPWRPWKEERELREIFAARGNAARSSTEREHIVRSFHEAMQHVRQLQQRLHQERPFNKI